MIEESPSFGYRTVAYLLGFNKNTVQRVFQLMGWQVRKWPIGFRPRIQTLLSVATMPNERWSTDLCRVWSGRDGWATLALVIDCHTRELLGWNLSRSGKTSTASNALEHALIACSVVLCLLQYIEQTSHTAGKSELKANHASQCVDDNVPKTSHGNVH